MNEDKLEMLELAVKEQAEEMTKLSQQTQDLISIVTNLRDTVGTFSEKQATQKITVEADTRPFQKIVESAFLKINFMIENALQNKRPNNLQVFFQSDANKWAVILVITVIFLTYSYWFSLHYLGR
ncbi:hypothetical protein A4D02_34680 [Niastella koreensis]|uniref:Uncharacterized protein n=2 Tax=Niastella koreensis TaxID=354356 RepID=G8TRS7_NIAKG|nr:hypothetical protein [Niastella koreensis]AEW02224.1 hypothetical protein Niako_5997 [Niastella koreensis GR20-10]OQP45099.1 hypothetical protein A4D02_34680 [Niastella koreensis]